LAVVDVTAAPAVALAELVALSSEIERAAIVDEAGALVGATPGADGERLARVAHELLAAAPDGVTNVEVALATGSVFVVRDGGRSAVATTGLEPASALVLHDLRTLLRRAGKETDGA
jgi:hypothetical protein